LYLKTVKGENHPTYLKLRELDKVDLVLKSNISEILDLWENGIDEAMKVFLFSQTAPPVVLTKANTRLSIDETWSFK
jgi:hypothetical protein